MAARALIDAGRLAEADSALDSIASNDEWEWRVDWYRGLRALAAGDPTRACEDFDTVYRVVPGELAAKLALACASESADRLEQAATLYDIVSRTDPGFTTAAFGLARCRSALGDHDGAVDAYDRVPESSSAYVDAQVAKVRGVLARDGQLSVGDVAGAGAVVARLPLGAELRAELSVDVLRAALPLVADDQADTTLTVLGCAMHEHGVRVGLEESYRTLARLKQVGRERIELVDEANAVRPRTLV
jgi:serine/threonine-protein kinase PknG